MNLRDMRVLVVGATGGIGRSLVRQLAVRDAWVLLAARRADALNELASQLAGTGTRVEVIVGDLATGGAAIARDALALAGRIDVVINCAGSQTFGYSQSEAALDTQGVFATNVIGPIQLVNALLPDMVSAGRGRIVNVGSIFGSIGYPCFASYSASKFALRGFSEALRRELSGTGVTVNYIAPRYTRTPFNGTAVAKMAVALGMRQDDPESVATRVMEAIDRDRANTYLGLAERIFVRLNAILPTLVDRSLASKLPQIHPFAVEAENR